jgi:hypothetical protein
MIKIDKIQNKHQSHHRFLEILPLDLEHIIIAFQLPHKPVIGIDLRPPSPEHFECLMIPQPKPLHEIRNHK